jgi:hypothetical protein
VIRAINLVLIAALVMGGAPRPPVWHSVSINAVVASR